MDEIEMEQRKETVKQVSIEIQNGERKPVQVTMEIHWFGNPSASRTILCLHGMTESGVVFREWGNIDDGFRILAVDRFGYGGTSDPLESWGYREFAFAVDRLLRTEGVTHVNAVIGHSSGGPCALAVWHYLGASRVNKCILVASDVEYKHSEAQRLRDPLESIAETFLLSPIHPDADGKQLGFVTEKELELLESTPYRESVRHNIGRTRGVQHDYHKEREKWDFDLRSSNQIFVVIGDQDPYLSMDHAKFFQSTMAAKIITVDGYAHFDIILDPEAIRKVLSLV